MKTSIRKSHTFFGTLLPYLACAALLHAQPAGGGSREERSSDEEAQPADETVDLGVTEREILDLANAFRKEHDLRPLEVSPALLETARDFARYMARTDNYGHHADGRRPSERAEAHGYDYCIVSENIAYEYRSDGLGAKELARELVQGWKNSPEHRENLLDPDVYETGVGAARSEESGNEYGVHLFGRPRSDEIVFRVVNRSETDVRYSIEGRAFPLPPRLRRTHRRCRPGPVIVFELPAEGGEREVERKAVGGRHYVVREADEGGVVVDEGP